jgi:hypothetical protein
MIGQSIHILDIRPKKIFFLFPVTQPTHSVYSQVDFFFFLKQFWEKNPILSELNFLFSGNSNFV